MSNNNMYPPKKEFKMLPSYWVVSIMIFLYLMISIMVGFNTGDWPGPLQIIFVLAELLGAILFAVFRSDLDENYIN